MATLKVAYNRFIASISRFWDRNPPKDDETAQEEVSIRVDNLQSTSVDPPTVVLRRPNFLRHNKNRLSVPRPVSLNLSPKFSLKSLKSPKLTPRKLANTLRFPSSESLPWAGIYPKLIRRSPSRMTSSEIRLSGSKTILTEGFLPRLNDYNTYFSEKPEQLRSRHTKKGELVVDGLLNIYWGLKTSIRLQVADDDVKIRPKVASSEEFGKNVGNRLSVPDSEGGVVEFDNAVWGKTRQRKSVDIRRKAIRLKVPSDVNNGTIEREEALVLSEGLKHTKSVIMRKKGSKNIKHRASINGHFYNHKTSVFTPALGSVTKVRVTSLNDAHTVITKLLTKFRVENPPEDFSLYVVKETQERRELSRDEFPLLNRVLIGPNEKLGKIFLMERKMHREITPEVAQYIKLDSSILEVFVKKFNEEEDREIHKMKKRFAFYKKMLAKEISQQQS